jgi:hypothetical protein
MEKTTINLNMKLQNAVTLQRWLAQLPLQGQKSRQRSQFCNILASATQTVEETRNKMLQELSNKDNDGNPMTYTDGDSGQEKFDMTPENEKEFNDKLTAFLATPINFVMTEDQTKLFNNIWDLLEKSTFEFKANLAEEYDSWLSSFENAT